MRLDEKVDFNNFNKYRLLITIFYFFGTLTVFTIIYLNRVNIYPDNIFYITTIVLIIALYVLVFLQDFANKIEEKYEDKVKDILINRDPDNPEPLDIPPEFVPLLEIIDKDASDTEKLDRTEFDYLIEHSGITSGKELIDLLVAGILIVVALNYWDIMNSQDMSGVIFTVVIILPSYFLHEGAHRVAANRYGLHSRFVLREPLVYLTLILTMVGAAGAIPGGVTTNNPKNYSDEKIGLIASSGILADFVLIIIGFFLILLRLPVLQDYSYLINELIEFNLFIAAINLIPMSILDGKKIWTWNRGLWVFHVMTVATLYVLYWFYF